MLVATCYSRKVYYTHTNSSHRLIIMKSVQEIWSSNSIIQAIRKFEFSKVTTEWKSSQDLWISYFSLKILSFERMMPRSVHSGWDRMLVIDCEQLDEVRKCTIETNFLKFWVKAGFLAGQSSYSYHTVGFFQGGGGAFVPPWLTLVPPPWN